MGFAGGRTPADPCPLLQPRQAAVVVVACAADRDAEPLGDLAQRQILEAGQLQRPPLVPGKFGECGAKYPAALLPGQYLRRLPVIERALVQDLDGLTVIRRTAAQRGLAPQRPV